MLMMLRRMTAAMPTVIDLVPFDMSVHKVRARFHSRRFRFMSSACQALLLLLLSSLTAAQCPSNFAQVNSRCVQMTSFCNPPYVLQSGLCVPPNAPSCQTGQVYVNGGCSNVIMNAAPQLVVQQPVAQPCGAAQPCSQVAPQPAVQPSVVSQPAPQPVVQAISLSGGVQQCPPPAPQPAVQPIIVSQPAPQPIVQPIYVPQPAPQPVVQPIYISQPAPQPAPCAAAPQYPCPQTVFPPQLQPFPQTVSPCSIPQPIPVPQPEPVTPPSALTLPTQPPPTYPPPTYPPLPPTYPPLPPTYPPLPPTYPPPSYAPQEIIISYPTHPPTERPRTTTTTTPAPDPLIKCPENTVLINKVCRLVFCGNGIYRDNQCVKPYCPPDTIWNGYRCEHVKPVEVAELKFSKTIVTESKPTPDVVINNVNNLVVNASIGISQSEPDILEYEHEVYIPLPQASPPPPVVPATQPPAAIIPQPVMPIPRPVEPAPRCCNVMGPRVCRGPKASGTRWNCASPSQRVCGSVCQAPKMMLKPPRTVAWRDDNTFDEMVLVPPDWESSASCQLSGGCAQPSNYYDCSGCAGGDISRCSSYCYNYRCSSRSCGYYDQQQYCSSNAGQVGCRYQDDFYY